MSMKDIQHPDCRACAERERLSLGQLAEIRRLKEKDAAATEAAVARVLRRVLKELEGDAT